MVEFENAQDRDYYVNEDPVHRAFAQSANEVAEKVQVVDFTDGVV